MDKRLLRQLYDKYRQEIYLYLYSLSRSREIAEDLVQETFVKALLALPEGHANVRAWLYTVARNLYFNFAKKQKTVLNKGGISPYSEGQESEKSPESALRESSATEPEEALIKNEKHRMLYKALQSLAADKREVLTLQYFGGLSQRQIATLIKKTPENIRVLAWRGKREIMKYMEEHDYDIS